MTHDVSRQHLQISKGVSRILQRSQRQGKEICRILRRDDEHHRTGMHPHLFGRRRHLAHGGREMKGTYSQDGEKLTVKGLPQFPEEGTLTEETPPFPHVSSISAPLSCRRPLTLNIFYPQSPHFSTSFHTPCPHAFHIPLSPKNPPDPSFRPFCALKTPFSSPPPFFSTIQQPLLLLLLLISIIYKKYLLRAGSLSPQKAQTLQNPLIRANPPYFLPANCLS